MIRYRSASSLQLRPPLARGNLSKGIRLMDRDDGSHFSHESTAGFRYAGEPVPLPSWLPPLSSIALPSGGSKASSASLHTSATFRPPTSTPGSGPLVLAFADSPRFQAALAGIRENRRY
jgi:hypothetical protein